MDKLDLDAVIASWAWRIKKTGKTQGEFAALLDGVNASQLSLYIKEHHVPTLAKYETIENKLRELGV